MGNLLEKYDTGGGPKVDKAIEEEYSVLFNLAGVYMPVRGGQWIWSLIRFVIYITLQLYFIYIHCITATFMNDFNMAARSYHYAILNFVTLNVLMCSIFKRKTINSLHNIIVDKFYAYENAETVKELNEWKSKIKRTKLAILVMLNGFFISIGITVLGGPSFDRLLGYSKKDQIENIDTRLPVDIWHPHSKESFVTFIVYLFVEVMSTSLCALLVAAADTLVIFIFLSLILQLKLLHGSITHIKEKEKRYHEIHMQETHKSSSDRLQRNRSYRKLECKICAKRCIKEIVVHHYVIERVFELVQEICLFPAGVAVVSGFITIAISLFALVMGESNPSDYLVSFFLLIGETGNIAMLCYFGQQMKDKSIEIQDALFETEWISFPKEVKLSMSIMLERLKRPLVFSAGGFAPLSYETFSKIMKASYNLFKFLVVAKDGGLTVITDRIKNKRWKQGTRFS